MRKKFRHSPFTSIPLLPLSFLFFCMLMPRCSCKSLGAFYNALTALPRLPRRSLCLPSSRPSLRRFSSFPKASLSHHSGRNLLPTHKYQPCIAGRWLSLEASRRPSELVSITSAAAKRISDIRLRDKRPWLLRVTVEPGGCHGFQYFFSLVPRETAKPNEDV